MAGITKMEKNDKERTKQKFEVRENSKDFLPPVNGVKKLSLELSFETESHM